MKYFSKTHITVICLLYLFTLTHCSYPNKTVEDSVESHGSNFTYKDVPKNDTTLNKEYWSLNASTEQWIYFSYDQTRDSFSFISPKSEEYNGYDTFWHEIKSSLRDLNVVVPGNADKVKITIKNSNGKTSQFELTQKEQNIFRTQTTDEIIQFQIHEDGVGTLKFISGSSATEFRLKDIDHL